MTENSEEITEEDRYHDRPEPLTIEIHGQRVTANMETWRGVVKLVQERRSADERAWRDERRAAGQVWTAIYHEYGRGQAEECFSLRDAQIVLDVGFEHGAFSPLGIRLPFGLIVDYATLTELPTDRAQEAEKVLADLSLVAERDRQAAS